MFKSDKRSAADEQDVARIDLNELLVRMLASALGRHIGDGPFDELEQRLLHPFARDVAGDGRAVALTADLVDFIDVDYATLGSLHIVVCRLQELEDDVFDIFTDVSCLCERSRIGQREGDVQVLREGLGQQRFPRACGPQHEDIALLELHIVGVFVFGRDALVVVVDSYRKNFLRPFLSHDVLIQVVFDFHRLFEFRRNLFFGFFPILGNDVVAEVDAFVADVDGGSGNQFADFVTTLSTERAAEMSIHLIRLRHESSPVTCPWARLFLYRH